MKTLDMETINYTKLVLVLGMLSSLLASPLRGYAQYTFNNTAAGTDDWSNPGNWDANGVPVGSANASVTVFPDLVTALGGDIVVTNDPANLTMNSLTLNGLANTTANVTVAIGTVGNIWTFDGTTPTVNLSGLNDISGTNLTFNVLPNLVLNQDLTIAGNGSATFNLNGNISGSQNMIKTGTSTVFLAGTNTYSGNTTVNGGGLCVNGGFINSPNGTLDVINGTATLQSLGSITVNTLLLTNNDLVSVTNSFFTTYSGTLTTSNTSWVIPANIGPTFRGTVNLDAGTHLFTPLVQNGFYVAGNLNVNSGANVGIAGNYLFKGFVGSPTATGGTMLVDNSSVTGLVSYLQVGGNTASSGASLIITNGGMVQLKSTAVPMFTVGSGNGANNAQIDVFGTNSVGQNSTLDLQGGRCNVGDYGAGGSYNNSVTVGSGGIVKNINLIMQSTNNSVMVTNGGQIVGITGGSLALVIGRSGGTAVGCISNVVTVAGTDGAGNPSLIDAGLQQCVIGYGSSGGSGDNTAYNGLVVANGGVVTNMTILRLGLATANYDCNNNYVLVSGGGKVYLTNSLNIAPVLRQNSNTVTVTGPGSQLDLGGSAAASTVVLAGVYTATNNSITIANGGAMTGVRYISISGANSTLTLDGGTIQFSTNNVFSGIIFSNTTYNPINPLLLVGSGGAILDTPYTGVNTVKLPFTEDPSSTDGGLTKLGSGILVLADANTYTGNTVISNGVLQLNTPTTLDTNTTVYVYTNTAAINLNYTGTNVVKNLYVNGIQQPQGVYGANPPGITGTGYLDVSDGAVTMPPTLHYVISGSPGSQSLDFDWTGSFKLQWQTANTLSAGLTTNWVDYPGGGSSPVSVPVGSSVGSAFFRLSQ